MSLEIKLTDFTPKVLAEFAERVDVGLDEIGYLAEGYAVAAIESSPRRVDTGLLRNSITHARSGQPPSRQTYQSTDGTKSGSYSGTADSGGKAVYIGTNVDYAGYVHDGTSRMEANRFLEAAADHGDQYREVMKRALSGE